MKKIGKLLNRLDLFAKYGHPNQVAPMEMEDEEYDGNLERLRRPGNPCGGICTLLLGIFVLYESASFFTKIYNKETIYNEKLYIANEHDKKIKYDTLDYADTFNPGFGFRNTKGFGRGNEKFDPLDNDYVQILGM